MLNELSKFYIQDFPPRAREVLNFWLVNKIFINFGVPCSLRVLFLLFIGWLNKSQPPPSRLSQFNEFSRSAVPMKYWCMYFKLSRSSDKQRLHITVVKTFHGFNALVSLINIEALFNTRAVALVQVKIKRSELSEGLELSWGTFMKEGRRKSTGEPFREGFSSGFCLVLSALEPPSEYHQPWRKGIGKDHQICTNTMFSDLNISSRAPENHLRRLASLHQHLPLHTETLSDPQLLHASNLALSHVQALGG